LHRCKACDGNGEQVLGCMGLSAGLLLLYNLLWKLQITAT